MNGSKSYRSHFGSSNPRSSRTGRASHMKPDWAHGLLRRLATDAESWEVPATVDAVPIMTVPIIDLTSILQAESSSEREAAANEAARLLDAACTSNGFFHLTGFETLMPCACIDEAFAAAHQYFSLSPECKLQDAMGQPVPGKPHLTTRVGYLPIGALPRGASKE